MALAAKENQSRGSEFCVPTIFPPKSPEDIALSRRVKPDVYSIYEARVCLGNGRPIRFGVFEADLHTGELRKQGVRIKLRDQPFQILLLLLAHPGEVVSRDELQKQLWPGDTFVDFDRGLNKAVNHLRDALGDSAESPRFIETLPKRGYRFIAPVDAASPNGHPLEPTRETQHSLTERPERWCRTTRPVAHRRSGGPSPPNPGNPPDCPAQ